MSLKKKFNPFTGNFDIYNDVTVLKFKGGVATQADLPSSGNEKNDARITNDNHHLYVWDGTQWVDQGDIFNIKWDSIENKPTSSTSDIDDAVSKKHSQNTDTKLDEGGVDEISAHEIKTKLIDINKFSPRNLAKNSIFEYWNGNIPEGWTLYAGSVFQESSDKLFGNYSVKVGPNANDVSSIKLVIDDSGIINYLKGKPVSIGVWAKGSSAQLRLKGYDGTLAQVTGASETSWTFLYAENKIIHQNTTEITIYLDSTDVNDYALFDGLMLIAGEKIISFIPRYEDDIEKNSASRHSQNTDSKIKNTDGDTSVETTDGDEIVFKNAGSEVLKILSSGVAKYYNTNRDISDLYHLVDKKYVDEAVTSLGARYYMLDTDSGISDYKLCSTTPSAGSEQSISKNDLTNDQYVIGWISPNTNEPDKLIAGVYNWRIYAEKTGSGTKTLRLYWKLIERKSDNSEVVIGTSVVSNEIVTGKNSYIIPLTLSADYDIASDSYMVGKIYAEVSGSGNDPSIILYYEGNSDSHWKIPVNTEILDGIYVKKTDSIDELGDVNISSPADGEVLTYNSTSGKWENQTGGSSSKIQDADGDTLLDTEETADKDEIVGKVAGVEALRIYNSGIIDFPKQSGCRVYPSATLTVPHNTDTKIHMDTEDWDTQNEFDSTTNYRFTATKSGKYLLYLFGAYSDLSDQDKFGLHFYKNGSKVIDPLMCMAATTADDTFSVRMIISLEANDYVEFGTRQLAGSDKTLRNGLNYCYGEIIKIQ